jgi:hypothetical protein
MRREEFLTAEESEAFLHSLDQPTSGRYLDMFIWEFECGSVKEFAAKVGYHPNRVSALKSATHGISPRLFRRMVEAYSLGKKERDFWGKRLLGIWLPRLPSAVRDRFEQFIGAAEQGVARLRAVTSGVGGVGGE